MDSEKNVSEKHLTGLLAGWLLIDIFKSWKLFCNKGTNLPEHEPYHEKCNHYLSFVTAKLAKF